MNASNKVVIIISRGFDDERSSVAWSIANASIASELDLTIFLVASGVDWARKGALESARLNPLDPPIGDMINNTVKANCKILVCPPCAKVRGYTEESLIEGAVLAGAPVMLEEVKAGAEVLSF